MVSGIEQNKKGIKKEKSRYIKKKDRDLVDKTSNFKCAWCGTNLMERHHIERYADGGQNDSDNLILLCPNCHTLVHQGKISENELMKRKKSLSGEVDRHSGNLSVIGKYKVAIGSNLFIDTPNIIDYNDEVILSVKAQHNNLYISLRLYDEKRNLICWMDENKWWVENNEKFDFSFNKKQFEVKYNENINIAILISSEDEIIEIRGSIYMNGYLLKFSKDDIKYFDEGCPTQFSVFKGMTVEKCNCAFKFDI